MIGACSSRIRSARRWASSSSTWDIFAAGVPSSGEKGKTPTRSMRASRRKAQSSSNSASPSPGRPAIRLVRSTRPGIRSRRVLNRARISSPVPLRFIRLRMLLLICWMGISRYLTILSLDAISSMSSSSN